MRYLALLGIPTLTFEHFIYRLTASPFASLLGYLGLYAPHPLAVARMTVAASLWPDVPEPRARRQLSETLYRLRRLLGEHCPVEADHHAIVLIELTTDVAEFRSLASSRQLDDWLAAVELYRGELVANCDDDWLRIPRMELLHLYLSTLGRVCKALVGQDDDSTALGYAQRWVAADPFNEQAHRLLMRILARSGRTAAALKHYRELVRLLDEEVQTPPHPTTRALAEAIQAEIAAPPPALRAPTATADPSQPKAEAPRPAVRRLAVRLARADAPLGRALHDDERVALHWTIDAGADDAETRRLHGKVGLRRARIVRLVTEAHAHGALPTDAELAQALGVSTRTIEADVAALRRGGVVVRTRRRAR